MPKNHAKDKLLHRGRNRKKRPKTFNTEEAAKKYAEEQGLKEYKLHNLKSANSTEKKFRIEF
jgi:hypothetical protein